MYLSAIQNVVQLLSKRIDSQYTEFFVLPCAFNHMECL